VARRLNIEKVKGVSEVCLSPIRRDPAYFCQANSDSFALGVKAESDQLRYTLIGRQVLLLFGVRLGLFLVFIDKCCERFQTSA
jgi:hypothetical protein